MIVGHQSQSGQEDDGAKAKEEADEDINEEKVAILAGAE